ncbi:Pycsar system effector family protein [Microbacterium sp. che218]|uniref:Pycsar system effector family protein n=1 Tax=Microbacterium sp. che218 TaxID=3140649 RepID=UPI0033669933
MGRKGVSAGASPADWEQSKLAIQETGGWIKNADAKATILAGSFGLSLTFSVPRLLESLPDVMTVPFAFGVWAVFTVVFLLTASITGFNIVRALIPRMSSDPTSLNRFAWPSLAQVSAGDSPPAISTDDQVRREAWEQAASLARVATTKFRYFKIALISFCICLGSLVALLVTQTVATGLG